MGLRPTRARTAYQTKEGVSPVATTSAAEIKEQPVSSERWDLIGTNRNTAGIPRWVIDAFAKMPGSHGTRLID